MPEELVVQNARRIIEPHEAQVNISWNGQNAELPDPVAFDSTDEQIKTWVTEAIRTGSIRALPADANVNLTNFVVDRFEQPTEDRPYKLLMVRPKVPFGELTKKQQEHIEVDLSQAIYEACIQIFEGNEHAGNLYGNGHHMAQEMSRKATEFLKSRWHPPTDKKSDEVPGL